MPDQRLSGLGFIGASSVVVPGRSPPSISDEPRYEGPSDGYPLVSDPDDTCRANRDRTATELSPRHALDTIAATQHSALPWRSFSRNPTGKCGTGLLLTEPAQMIAVRGDTNNCMTARTHENYGAPSTRKHRKPLHIHMRVNCTCGTFDTSRLSSTSINLTTRQQKMHFSHGTLVNPAELTHTARDHARMR